jgi:hypothetical protein
MAKAPKETHHYYLREQFVPAISFSFSVKRDYAPATHYYYYYLFFSSLFEFFVQELYVHVHPALAS